MARTNFRIPLVGGPLDGQTTDRDHVDMWFKVRDFRTEGHVRSGNYEFQADGTYHWAGWDDERAKMGAGGKGSNQGR